MKLCYRGAKYNPQAKPVETTDSGVVARFMGRTYTLRQTNMQNFMPSEVLKYRGVTYQGSVAKS